MDSGYFARQLVAEAAHPEQRLALGLFGQFVGVWDLDVQFFDESERTVFDGIGEWTFAWVLDGRAIQDVLVYDTPENYPAARGQRRIGSSLRLYHPDREGWTMVWAGATTGNFLTLTARGSTEGILITGPDADGSLLQWTFTDVRDDSFTWSGMTAPDGESWRLEQRMHARRRS